MHLSKFTRTPPSYFDGKSLIPFATSKRLLLFFFFFSRSFLCFFFGCVRCLSIHVPYSILDVRCRFVACSIYIYMLYANYENFHLFFFLSRHSPSRRKSAKMEQFSDEKYSEDANVFFFIYVYYFEENRISVSNDRRKCERSTEHEAVGACLGNWTCPMLITFNLDSFFFLCEHVENRTQGTVLLTL